MSMIYRNTFYAFVVVLVTGISTLNQETAQLKDLIALLQSREFLPWLVLMAAALCCLEIFVDTVMSAVAEGIDGVGRVIQQKLLLKRNVKKRANAASS